MYLTAVWETCGYMPRLLFNFLYRISSVEYNYFYRRITKNPNRKNYGFIFALSILTGFTLFSSWWIYTHIWLNLHFLHLFILYIYMVSWFIHPFSRLVWLEFKFDQAARSELLIQLHPVCPNQIINVQYYFNWSGHQYQRQ